MLCICDTGYAQPKKLVTVLPFDGGPHLSVRNTNALHAEVLQESKIFTTELFDVLPNET